MAFDKKPAGAPKQALASGKKKSGGGNRISIKPSDQQAGGLLDDQDVTLTELAWTTWDYNGQQEPQLALLVKIKPDDPNEKELEQYFSAGKLERMVPSDDGNFVEAAEGSNATGLNDSTNAAAFLRSLVEAGFPEDKIEEHDGSIAVFEGMNCHVNRIAQKKRSGLQQDSDGKQKTVLLVTKINRLPWEQKGAKSKVTAMAGKTGASAAKPAAKAAEANGAGGDLNDEAMEAVVKVLGDNDNTVPKKKLAMLVFRAIPGTNKNRSAIMQLVADDEFLTQDGAPWEFDGTDVTAA